MPYFDGITFGSICIIEKTLKSVSNPAVGNTFEVLIITKLIYTQKLLICQKKKVCRTAGRLFS